MKSFRRLVLAIVLLISCFSVSWAQDLYKCTVINPYDNYLVEGYLIRSLMNNDSDALARIIALRPSGSIVVEKLPAGLYYFLYRGYEAKGEAITDIYYQSYVLKEDFEIKVGFFREDLEPKEKYDEVPDLDDFSPNHMNEMAKR